MKIRSTIIYFLVLITFLAYALFAASLNNYIIAKGQPYRLYIIFLPNLLGTLALLIIMWPKFKKSFATKKNRKFKAFTVNLCSSFMVSILTIGTIARLAFNIINYNIIKNAKAEVIEVPITGFSNGRDGTFVCFTLNNKSEELRYYAYELDHDYLDNYLLSLTIKKGAMNTFTVITFSAVDKKTHRDCDRETPRFYY